MDVLLVDKALSSIRGKQGTVVLLVLENEAMSSRSKSILDVYFNKLLAKGYEVMCLPYETVYSSYEELACVRLPQLRVFSYGNLLTKIVGIPVDSDFESILEKL